MEKIDRKGVSMFLIKDQELLNIRGGQVSWGMIGLFVGGIITFIIGVIDGYKRPLKCNR